MRSLKKREKLIKKDPGMRSVFLDPDTGHVWKLGDVYKHPLLAKTLQTIADKVKIRVL